MWTGFICHRLGTICEFFECGNELWCSITCKKFLDQLNDYQVFKDSFFHWVSATNIMQH